MAAAAALAALAVVPAACSSEGSAIDRSAAVDDLLVRYPGQNDRAQAECYVDRVTDELGVEALAPDAEPTDAQIRRLTAIRVDCIGVGNLGRSATSVPAVGEEAPVTVRGPRTFGDDPELDALWAACEAGDGPACDALFEAAPLASEYEAFGASCGGRGAEERCGDVYPALPSSSTTSPAPEEPAGG